MKLCHLNLAYLLGVCLEISHKMIVLAFHGIDSVSYSIHSILVSFKPSKVDISFTQWKVIVAEIISGLYYLHEKCKILHNNVNEDNIVLHQENKKITDVIVDFGKACAIESGKKYSL